MDEDSFPAVLAAAQQGDDDAVSELYRSTAPIVLGYFRAHKMVDAEDLTGDVFVSMIRSLSRFEGSEAQFRSWLLTIAHRRYVDAVRVLARRPSEPMATDQIETHLIDLSSTESEAISRLRASGIVDAIDDLTPDQRSVLLLRVLADLPIKDIAEITGKPVTAVKALLRRASAALARRLHDQGFSAPEGGAA